VLTGIGRDHVIDVVISWCHAVCCMLSYAEGYNLLGCDTMEPGIYVPSAQRMSAVLASVQPRG